jgi:flagellum-specific peptidoglycan hydrolase FlgJ
MERSTFVTLSAIIIKSMATVYGYKFPSAIIAMAILESNYGQSLLASKYHNYHGMKCGSTWKGGSVNLATKEEYTPGTLTNIRDNFRTYKNMYDGMNGHFQFLQYKRYENLKDATSPRDYLKKIVADGYCTSTSYVENCMRIIDYYSLTDFD